MDEDNVRYRETITLGELIAQLQALPESALDKRAAMACGMCLHRPVSYRGYYEQMAWQATSYNVTAGEFLSACLEAVCKTMTGYKGGEFMMGSKTLQNVVGSTSESGDIRIAGIENHAGGVLIVTFVDED
jgi:hypothetical protein